jgi:hypothetical protein
MTVFIYFSFPATHNGFSRIRRRLISSQRKHRTHEKLNKISGEDIWYDTFDFQNRKWLWFVNGIVVAMNSNKLLCGSFRLYPSFVAGILNSVKEINFCVLCNELKYADYIENVLSHTGDYFQLSSNGETIAITFETKIIHGKLSSELTFAYAVFIVWFMV